MDREATHGPGVYQGADGASGRPRRRRERALARLALGAYHAGPVMTRRRTHHLTLSTLAALSTLALLVAAAPGCKRSGAATSEAADRAPPVSAEPGRAPKTLVDHQEFPRFVALDADNVYWFEWASEGSTLHQLARRGDAAPTVLAGSLPSPSALVARDGVVYVASQEGRGDAPTTILRIAAEGGEPETLAREEGLVRDLVVDQGALFWSATSADAIRRRPLEGGEIVTLAGDVAAPGAIAVDPRHVYWVSAGRPTRGVAPTFNRIARDGGAPERLAELAASPSAITLAGDHIVYAIHRSTTATARPEPCADEIFAFARRSGESARIACGRVLLPRLAAHGATIYFAERESEVEASRQAEILAVDVSGGPIRRIAERQNGPAGLAVDAEALYWVNSGELEARDGALVSWSF